MLTRRETATRLGITYDRLRALERSRVVVGRQIKGVWHFDQADLDLVEPTVHRLRPDSREGELAAEAFKLFRDGASDAEVVIALRMVPARVRELRASYDPEAIMLSGDDVREARRELAKAGRGFERARDLLAELGELCQRDQRLTALELEAREHEAKRSRARRARDTLPAPPSC